MSRGVFMVVIDCVIECTCRSTQEFYERRFSAVHYDRVWDIFKDLKSSIRELNCNGYDVNHLHFDCTWSRGKKKG